MLLARAAELSGRTFTEASAVAWYDIIGHYEYDEALRSLNAHFAKSTDFLLPAHVVKGIKKDREDRGYRKEPPPGRQWAADVIENGRKPRAIE